MGSLWFGSSQCVLRCFPCHERPRPAFCESTGSFLPREKTQLFRPTLTPALLGHLCSLHGEWDFVPSLCFLTGSQKPLESAGGLQRHSWEGEKRTGPATAP